MNTQINWLEEAQKGIIKDIGQIPAPQRRSLERAVKRGEIVKFRAGWFHGFMAIKTHFAPSGTNPDVVFDWGDEWVHLNDSAREEFLRIKLIKKYPNYAKKKEN